MRIFVTGASGWIGSAVVPELQRAGHDVLGLALSDDAAAVISDVGAEVLRGDLDDLDALGKGAGACDGVVHLGYNHDFSRMADAADTDRDDGRRARRPQWSAADRLGGGRPHRGTGRDRGR